MYPRTVVAQAAGDPVADAHEHGRPVGDPRLRVKITEVKHHGLWDVVMGGRFGQGGFDWGVVRSVVRPHIKRARIYLTSIRAYLEAEDKPHVEEVDGPGGGAGQGGVVLLLILVMMV